MDRKKVKENLKMIKRMVFGKTIMKMVNYKKKDIIKKENMRVFGEDILTMVFYQ